MLSRRDFIKALGVLGAVILTPFHRLTRTQEVQAAPAADNSLLLGEVYAGFLLLSEDTPVPGFVRKPTVGPPIVCGVETGKGGPKINAMLQSFDTLKELRKRINFPIYTLSSLPDQFHPAGGYLLGYDTGQIYGVSLGYQAVDTTNRFVESTISLWAQPHFSRPSAVVQ